MTDVKNLPGMKEKELRPCDLCGGHLGLIFYRSTVNQAVVDSRAAHRQIGLGMTLGSAALAGVMGPNEDIAKITKTTEKLLCSDCAMTTPVLAAWDDD